MLETRVVDLAFVDLSLDPGPERTGLKVLAEIQRYYPTTVAVSMTGHDEDRLVEECLKSGASDYLLKPFDAQETLKQVLRKAPRLFTACSAATTELEEPGRQVLRLSSPSSCTPSRPRIFRCSKRPRRCGAPRTRSSSAARAAPARKCWRNIYGASRGMTRGRLHRRQLRRHHGVAIAGGERAIRPHKRGAFSGATDHRQGKFESR